MQCDDLESMDDVYDRLRQLGTLGPGYFRLCIAKEIEQNQFIQNSTQLFELLKENVVELGLVRYTKPQATQLRPYLATEELIALDESLSTKRTYTARKTSCPIHTLQLNEASKILENRGIKDSYLAVMLASGIPVRQVEHMKYQQKHHTKRKKDTFEIMSIPTKIAKQVLQLIADNFK